MLQHQEMHANVYEIKDKMENGTGIWKGKIHKVAKYEENAFYGKWQQLPFEFRRQIKIAVDNIFFFFASTDKTKISTISFSKF